MFSKLKYNDDGLVPAIIQDAASGEVLMMGYMNERSIRRTVESGFTHFWSRSRQQYWKKGETSGHTQEVKEVLVDCDADTLLVRVHQHGPGACHTGHRSCFYRDISGNEVAAEVFSKDEVYGREDS